MHRLLFFIRSQQAIALSCLGDALLRYSQDPILGSKGLWGLPIGGMAAKLGLVDTLCSPQKGPCFYQKVLAISRVMDTLCIAAMTKPRQQMLTTSCSAVESSHSGGKSAEAFWILAL